VQLIEKSKKAFAQGKSAIGLLTGILKIKN